MQGLFSLLSVCRCLGDCQVWTWLFAVVPDLLGAVPVILCQLWQPCGVLFDISSSWWGELSAVTSSICKSVQKLHHIFMGASQNHSSVYTTAYSGQR